MEIEYDANTNTTGSAGKLFSRIILCGIVAGQPYAFSTDTSHYDQYTYNEPGTGAYLAPDQCSNKFLESSGQDIEAIEQERSKYSLLFDKFSTIFDLTREDVARIFGVTKKTLYNWIDRDNIAKEKHIQIYFKISSIVERWELSGYDLSYTQINQKSYSGKSIKDVLFSKVLNPDEVMFMAQSVYLDNYKPGVLNNPFNI